jgi:hypothetical protein
VSTEESGTTRHVKGMAAATYLYESERGNTYPRLELSIDYRSPKNIRIRAYDGEHHVADSIGANDVAEAILLAGQAIRSAETMHAKRLRQKGDEGKPKRRLPVAVRFMNALTLALRRQGQAGAAEAVVQAASLQFHPANWKNEREHRQVLGLAELALEMWAVRGLDLLGGETEATLARQLAGYISAERPMSAATAADAGKMLSQIDLPNREPDGNPHMPRPVSQVLAEVSKLLEAVAETTEVPSDEAPALPGDPLARAVEHAALALAAAFKAGIVTALPPASGQVFAMLAQLA